MRLATNNSIRSWIPTQPLFHKLDILTVYDIYMFQLGTLLYEFKNNIGPINNIINLTPANDIHDHYTRYASSGNLHVRYVRTTRYGLKSIQFEGAKFWVTLPFSVKNKPSKNTFKSALRKFLLSNYDNPS